MSEQPTVMDRFNAMSSTKVTIIAAVLTFLGTSAGTGLLDRFFPNANSKFLIIMHELQMQGKDIESMKSALWRMGAGTNIERRVQSE